MGNLVSSGGKPRLVIECEDGTKGFCPIENGDTLAHVRSTILADFDTDMVPNEFYFLVDGIRFSVAQEPTVPASNLTTSCIRILARKRRSSTESSSPKELNKKARLETPSVGTTQTFSTDYETPAPRLPEESTVMLMSQVSTERSNKLFLSSPESPPVDRPSSKESSDFTTQTECATSLDKEHKNPATSSPTKAPFDRLKAQHTMEGHDGDQPEAGDSMDDESVDESDSMAADHQQPKQPDLDSVLASTDRVYAQHVQDKSDFNVRDIIKTLEDEYSYYGALSEYIKCAARQRLVDLLTGRAKKKKPDEQAVLASTDRIFAQAVEKKIDISVKYLFKSLETHHTCELSERAKAVARQRFLSLREEHAAKLYSMELDEDTGDQEQSINLECPENPDEQAVLDSTDLLLSTIVDKSAVTVKDIFKALEAEYNFKMQRPLKAAVRQRLRDLMGAENREERDDENTDLSSDHGSVSSAEEDKVGDEPASPSLMRTSDEDEGTFELLVEEEQPDKDSVLESSDNPLSDLMDEETEKEQMDDASEVLVVEQEAQLSSGPSKSTTMEDPATELKLGEDYFDGAMNTTTRAPPTDGMDEGYFDGAMDTAVGAPPTDDLEEDYFDGATDTAVCAPPIESMNVDDEVVVTTANKIDSTNDTHRKHDMAIEKSCSVLREIKTALEQHPMFCSDDRRQEFMSEISDLLSETSSPQTIIGVLGSTGVGKSSLLNALLDEASILPTSGSRGCTACVVELRYNSALKSDRVDQDDELAVYRGEVEFMTLDEWLKELKILVEECSTHEEKTIYARTPDGQRQPDAAAAWSKINQVYGSGTMERYTGSNQSTVLRNLQSNARVRKLLLPANGNGSARNSIFVEEGSIHAAKVEELLSGLDGGMGPKLRNSLKKWGKSFRGKINDYVYRKGSGREPQTWPLIRKVVLNGPWPILSTGACLVDLPGVRDANAARAKVAEQYLQNCSRIWIAAPIKRAVDDGTAKELLGENFKRRLLMDGQYGSVSFICTQTDDCEATETMTDHQDVAERLGRWEVMKDMYDRISGNEQQLSDLHQKDQSLQVTHEDAMNEVKEQEEELAQELASGDDDDNLSVDVENLAALQTSLDEKKKAAKIALKELKVWRAANSHRRRVMASFSRKLQRKLKAMCAIVRNEYSKTCLRADFRAGLEELTQGVDGDDENQQDQTAQTAIPNDFEMDVYCVSANDYLKLRGIKPASDGQPNAFTKVGDTQIPALRDFVHDTTATSRSAFTERFADATSNLLDRAKLVASDANGATSCRASRRFKNSFESSMQDLDGSVHAIVKDFRKKAVAKIASTLKPALAAGAAKGKHTALETVSSWSSTSRRTKQARGPGQNGLHYQTYTATIRRGGAYVSKSAGSVDMNQELCDPMEKEFATDWQRIMDSAIRVYLGNAEKEILAVCENLDKALTASFSQAGVKSDRLHSLRTAASRGCATAVKSAFAEMKNVATNCQRELNRSLLPKIQERMTDSYRAALDVPGGTGVFARRAHAMRENSNVAVESMFIESTKELSEAVEKLVETLASMISATASMLLKCMENVFSILWEDQASDKAGLVDPVQQQLIRQCRDKFLPILQRLAGVQAEALGILGIQREDLELDVVGVDSAEDRFDKQLKAAQDMDLVVDLCDSDDDEDLGLDRKPAARNDTASNVKAEPLSPSSKPLGTEECSSGSHGHQSPGATLLTPSPSCSRNVAS